MVFFFCKTETKYHFFGIDMLILPTHVPYQFELISGTIYKNFWDSTLASINSNTLKASCPAPDLEGITTGWLEFVSHFLSCCFCSSSSFTTQLNENVSNAFSNRNSFCLFSIFRKKNFKGELPKFLSRVIISSYNSVLLEWNYTSLSFLWGHICNSNKYQ